MSVPHITSASNPTIKSAARLHKRRERRRRSRFLIEGRREIARAVAAGVEVETLFVCPGLAGERGAPPQGLDDSVEIVTTSAAALNPLSRRQHPDGMVAVARSPSHALEDLELARAGLVLLVERVEKPGNLGAMIRSAVGAGASAVVAADAETDFENPNVIRASQGSVFTLPVAASSTPEAVAAIDAAGITRVTLDPGATRPIWDVDLSGRVAIAVGAEAAGVSEALVRGSTPAAIPMAGAADSLNVSVAAAIALYEAVRQRRTD